MLQPAQARKYFESRLKGQRFGCGPEIRTHCRFHEDKTPSLSVNLERGIWKCFAGCGEGGILDFEMKLANCDRATAKLRVAEIVGEQVFRAGEQPQETYQYHDEQRRLVFEKLRYPGKRFVLRRPTGKGYEYTLEGVKKPLYRLPEVVTANEVFVCEGEKDADNVRAAFQREKLSQEIKLASTTNFDGACKWRDEYAPYFAGKKVVVFPDNDEPGRKHAEQVATSLHPFAAGVKVVNLPGLQDKGDVSDYLLSHSFSELVLEIKKAPQWRPAVLQPISQNLTENCASTEGEIVSPEFSDDHLALEFTRENRDTLRYTAELSKYYRWTSTSENGGVWERDTILKTFDGVRQLCRKKATLSDTTTRQQRLCSAATVSNVERLIRTDQQIAITVDQWDAHTMLLNTPSGIVDLATGEKKTVDSIAYCTKITACAPETARPVLWEQCLGTWTNHNADLQQYLKRVCGYCLTGETREHQFFFLHGCGRNGKSVFLNTVSGILNSYAKTAPAEVFTLPRSGEKHPTALAGLVGCRLALATETEANSKWAETQLKALVSGDVMATRFMRQDFFEFKARFKLMVSGNHRPSLSSVDEAIRARLNLLPFEVLIPPEQRDTKLSHKLRAEWGSILQWMIEGCLEWQRDGLRPPSCVRLATDDYLQDQDLIGQWLKECCIVGPQFQCKGKALYSSWQAWCGDHGQFSTSQRSFIGSLKERPNIRHEHTESGNHFAGVGLRSDVGEKE